RLFRLLREVHEDEASPNIALDGNEAVLVLVEVEELALLLNERERALEVVAPPVVLARELPADALGCLAREVVPHELVPAVTAHVVKGPDLSLLVADNDDRRVGGCDVLREVAPDARKPFDPTDVEPCALEDRVLLAFEVLGRDRVLVRERFRAEVVVLRPASFGRFRETRHRCPPRHSPRCYSYD